MARKRKFYRITTTQFDILAAAAEDFASDHPGHCTDHITAVINEIRAAHAPKTAAKAEPAVADASAAISAIVADMETAVDAAVAANATNAPSFFLE